MQPLYRVCACFRHLDRTECAAPDSPCSDIELESGEAGSPPHPHRMAMRTSRRKQRCPGGISPAHPGSGTESKPPKNRTIQAACFSNLDHNQAETLTVALPTSEHAKCSG